MSFISCGIAALSLPNLIRHTVFQLWTEMGLLAGKAVEEDYQAAFKRLMEQVQSKTFCSKGECILEQRSGICQFVCGAEFRFMMNGVSDVFAMLCIAKLFGCASYPYSWRVYGRKMTL